MLPAPGLIYTDRVKPTVAITNPPASTQTGTINLVASASDNDQIVGVQFFLDGVAFGAEDLVSPYQVSLNTATLTTGNHTVYAIARDRLGNTQQSATVTFPVADQHPPTVSLTSPTAGTKTGSITISATASDDVGVTHIDFYVDGGYVGSTNGMSYDTRNLADGAHTVQAYAFDAAGNQSPVSTVNITTANNIVFLGAGAGISSASPGSIPAGSLIIVAIYMAGGSPASLGDNGGNSYTLLAAGGVAGDPADGIGGSLWVYGTISAAPMTAYSVDGAGDQVNVAVAAYARANGGEHFASGPADWGGWGGPGFGFATAREVAVAVTVAGYDGNSSISPNPAVAVAGPFTKRAAVTDHDLSWAELAISDWITASGGSGSPNGSTNNAAHVYGVLVAFEGS